MLRRLSLAAATVIAFAALAGVAEAAPRIAFADFTGDDSDIFTVNAGGKDRKRVTSGGANDFEPDWSPDRKWIVFMRNKAGSQQTKLYRVRPSGAGLKEIPNTKSAEAPSWSKDGKRIAYVEHTAEHEVVVTIRPDGSGRKRVTSDDYDAANPAWAPDGRRIAFERSGAIWQIQRDGTKLRKVVGNGVQPDWAPGGGRIAYVNRTAKHVFTIRPDGTQGKQLTTGGFEAANPAWAPDGRRIAFEQATPQATRIATIAYPGGAPGTKRLVTAGYQPAW